MNIKSKGFIKLVSYITCLSLLLVFNAGYLWASMTSGNYQIWSDSFSTGGGNDQSTDNYTLRDTLGEFGIGQSSSTNNNAKIGFREMSNSPGAASTVTLTASGSSVSLGELSTASTATGSMTLTAYTNSSSGLSVTYTGSTLTCSACSGTNTVSGIGSSAAASTAGSSQFGFNAIYSSGSSPVASSVSPYNSASQYAYSSGDQIISSSEAINSTVFDINFIANISGSEESGSYATTVTYTAVVNP
jgi:hypothetical protein